MLPMIIKNWNAFIDGVGYVGIAEEVVTPVLERVTESYRAAGMLGEIELDLGVEAMKLEMTLAQFDKNVLQQFGIRDASGVGVRLMAAGKADSADSNVDAIEISVRGRWKKIDPGTLKAGDLAKMKVEMPLTYFKYTLNGNVLVEIDMITGLEKVNGVDLSAALRQALGMAT
ncbi:P2 family phage contractile tail tube protein [Thalassospira sp. MBR-102]|jgi:P2 family phage contractile tail tube protein|uniref:phage major tail tube protein n=1 Tax=Thalassospira sp. MBR-102 TaxID=3156466 RepID=UPI00339225BD